MGKKIGVYKVADEQGESSTGENEGKASYMERVRDTRTSGDVS